MKVDSQGGTGTGAVYIYMGSRSGLEKDAVQVITYENDKYFILFMPDHHACYCWYFKQL